MGKQTVFDSVTSFDDFIKNMPGTYVTTGALLENQWKFISAENAAQINSGAGAVGYVRLKLGKFYAGDTLEVNLDFLNISGTKGAIIIDRDGQYAVNRITSTNGDNYERTTLIHAIDTDDVYYVAIGIFSGAAGIIKMRNLTMMAKTIYHNRHSNMRKASFYKNVDGNWVDTPSRVNDPNTISTYDANTLLLTFDYPLDNVPTILGGLEYYGPSSNFVVRSSYARVDSIRIQFFDLTSADPTVPVDLSLIPQLVYANILLIA